MIPEHPYIHGISLPKLHGVLAAAMFLGPERADRFEMLSASVVATYNATDSGKRIWIEVSINAGPATRIAYICLDPGECRHEQPGADSDIVVPMVQLESKRNWCDTIAAVAHEAATDDFFGSDLLSQLINEAEAVVKECKRGSPMFVPMATRLNNVIDSMASSPPDRDDEMFQSLYQAAVGRFEFPIQDYAFVELMLRMQLVLGFKIDVDVTRIGATSLIDFLRKQEADFVASVVNFLSQMGKLTLREGKVSVRAALAQATVFEFQHRLLHAAYCYSIAKFAAVIVEGLCQSSQLGYKALVAEESLVCTMTGLFYGAQEGLAGYHDIVDDIERALTTDRAEDARKVVHKYSSEIFPVLPESVLNIFLARAQIARRDEHLAYAVQQLDSLWQARQGTFNDEYERSLLENGLLAGYKAMGDTEKVAKFAIRIAGIMVVGKGVNDEP